MELIIKALLALAVVLVISSIGGIIVWATWDSLSTAFPYANIPQEISLWTAIKLSWLFSILIKTSSNLKSSK